MFVEAIEEVGRFTRPIHTISRNYLEQAVNPGAATLFFVNEGGVAVTCRHVMELVGNRAGINERYFAFKQAAAALGRNNKYNLRLKALEQEYNMREDAIVQLKELFYDVTGDPSLKFRWIAHPKYDLAIVIFEGIEQKRYEGYARFINDSSVLKQGKFLCRLGFPFPEFTNYEYRADVDDIEWTSIGKMDTPRFPIEGMITRHLVQDGEMVGIEMSTPGLRGQSGGPLFDRNGLVCGMQSGTNHLHLGFDIRGQELKINGKLLKVNNQPFLHVGHCVHVDLIKQFLSANGVKYYVGD